MRLRQLAIRRAVIVGLAACALPAAHGERLLLSEPAPASSFVPQGYLASPDGEWVVYRHDPAVDNAYELYAVRRDASARVRLSYPLPTGTAVDSFAIASDSRRVVFLVAQEIPGVKELWSVAIEGPSESAIKLNPAGYRVRAFELSADGARVAFEVEPTGGGPVEVWSVPIAGPAASAVQLSPPASPPMSGVWQGSIRISPDGSRAVWIGDFATAGIQFVAYLVDIVVDGQFELRKVPVIGGMNEVLSGSMPAFAQVVEFSFTSDSLGVLFRADMTFANSYELFVADRWIFSADFEEGDTSEWSTSSP